MHKSLLRNNLTNKIRIKILLTIVRSNYHMNREALLCCQCSLYYIIHYLAYRASAKIISTWKMFICAALCFADKWLSTADSYQSDLSRDVTFQPLFSGPVYSCTISTPRCAYIVLQPSRLIVHIAIWAYSLSPGSNETFEGEVPCPRT